MAGGRQRPEWGACRAGRIGVGFDGADGSAGVDGGWIGYFRCVSHQHNVFGSRASRGGEKVMLNALRRMSVTDTREVRFEVNEED